MGLLKESLFQRIVDVEKKSEMRSSSIWPSGETCRHNPGVLAWLGWHCLGPNEMGLEFVTGAGKHKLILALRSSFWKQSHILNLRVFRFFITYRLKKTRRDELMSEMRTLYKSAWHKTSTPRGSRSCRCTHRCSSFGYVLVFPIV